MQSSSIQIGYIPFANEPKLSFLKFTPTVVVSQSALVDPSELGNKLAAQFAGSSVCIYVPGSAFDRYGTRHGRGGGWYDRFLAAVPAEWTRVGVCFESCFSSFPLRREEWDQPVDWVCVQTITGVSCYKTNARKII